MKNKIYGIFFILTGIFALVGGLFTWGTGPIWEEGEIIKKLLPLADLLLATPLSLLAGAGLLSKKAWGTVFGLVSCGIYLYGSAQVYIIMTENEDFNILWTIPTVFGVVFSGLFINYSINVLEKRELE